MNPCGWLMFCSPKIPIHQIYSNLASVKMDPCHFAVRKVRNQSLFESSSSAKMQLLQSETRNARGHGAYWYPARIFLHRSRDIL